jgi:hypothetical protein
LTKWWINPKINKKENFDSRKISTTLRFKLIKLLLIKFSMKISELSSSIYATAMERIDV